MSRRSRRHLLFWTSEKTPQPLAEPSTPFLIFLRTPAEDSINDVIPSCGGDSPCFGCLPLRHRARLPVVGLRADARHRLAIAKRFERERAVKVEGRRTRVVVDRREAGQVHLDQTRLAQISRRLGHPG